MDTWFIISTLMTGTLVGFFAFAALLYVCIKMDDKKQARIEAEFRNETGMTLEDLMNVIRSNTSL